MKTHTLILTVFFLVLFSPVSRAADDQMIMQLAQAFLGGGQQQGTNTRQGQGGALLIYGDVNQDVYLGCLNCSVYDRDSVTNPRSPFASQNSQTSLYNPRGPFGSQNSDLSACSRFAENPPVVVDENGQFYGRLTLNNFHRDAIQDQQILSWLQTEVCTGSGSLSSRRRMQQDQQQRQQSQGFSFTL